jgi:hypothetical protein
MTASLSRNRSTVSFLVAWFVTGAAAFAQTPTETRTNNWSAIAGYERFALRDIARTSQPVDASPVAWRGSGPMLVVQHERRRGHWLHRFQSAASFVGNFAYRSLNRSTDLSGEEMGRVFDGRYDLRRAIFPDRFVRGLEADIGVQGIGSFTTFRHEVPVDLVQEARILSTGPAVVAGARLRRWSRVGIDVDYINGRVIGKFTRSHSGAGLAMTRVGETWLTDFIALATIRLTPKAALAVRYFDSGSGFIASYQNYAISRRSVSAGVTYVP